MKFLAARYNVGTLDARFLKPRIMEIIAALAFYGFVVDTVVRDGASKNRSLMRQLATLPADELSGDALGGSRHKLHGGSIGKSLRQRLPMDKKIAV